MQVDHELGFALGNTEGHCFRSPPQHRVTEAVAVERHSLVEVARLQHGAIDFSEERRRHCGLLNCRALASGAFEAVLAGLGALSPTTSRDGKERATCSQAILRWSTCAILRIRAVASS